MDDELDFAEDTGVTLDLEGACSKSLSDLRETIEILERSVRGVARDRPSG